MKSQLLFLLLCFLPIFIIAQNYSLLGAIGHYDYAIWPTPPSTFPKGYVTIEALDDTLIQGKQSSILLEMIYSPSGLDTGNTYYIHATDSVVYDFDPNNNFSMGILYDYRLGAGDSLVLGNHAVTLHIDSVANRTINGQNRVVQFISQSSLHSFLEGESIQGIGNEYYFFPTHDNDQRGGLRCYNDSYIGNYHHPGSDSCTAFITSLEELADVEHTIELFPNPAKEQIWIKDLPKGTAFFDYAIFDAKGSILIRKDDFSIAQAIDIANLETGLYYLSVRFDGKIRLGKFVKK